MEKTTEKKKYFVVRERAVPEVLLKVVQAKRLLDSGRAQTVQDGNILTIHQSIPINGIATLTLSVDILPGEGDAEAMVEEIESREGIHYLKILGRE